MITRVWSAAFAVLRCSTTLHEQNTTQAGLGTTSALLKPVASHSLMKKGCYSCVETLMVAVFSHESRLPFKELPL